MIAASTNEMTKELNLNLHLGKVAVGVGLVVGSVFFSGTYYVSGGEYARVQPANGKHQWITEQGYNFKMPFLSKVEFFNQYNTIDITSNENDEATMDVGAHRVIFADTYGGTIEVTARYKLDPDDTKLESMYQANKRNSSLVSNTLLPNVRNLLNQTASQFRGEDFMQGGQNEFLSRLYYQADNGLYVTKRTKKMITEEKGYSDLKDAGKAGSPKTGKAFIWSVEIQTDKNGNPLTQESQLDKFGINLDLIEINSFNPDPDLRSFMNEKKNRIKARARIIEEQQNERQQAITAELKGKREIIEARNAQLIKKDRAVIAEKQKVEVAEQQAKLAKVDKQKELDIAKANKGIQEANYESAKYEARAIKETGLAEAAVEKAKYQAKDKSLYLKELELQNNKELYRALPQMRIDMPTIMSTGGGNATSENIGNASSLFILDKLGMKTTK